MPWSMLKQKIRSEYPMVSHLAPDSLHTWLQSEDHRTPLLLDVREADEYAVSHLPGARRVDPDTDDFGFLDAVPRDTPIVAYCSVGYRSSALSERLQAAGFTQVHNLEGSIFAWVNAGYPVYRDTMQVQGVHPYNRLWGQLVKARYRQYTPEEKP